MDQPLDTAAGITTIMRASFEEMTWESEPSAVKSEPAPAVATRSVIDMDDTHATSPPPALATAKADYFADDPAGLEDSGSTRARPFSDSIFNDPIVHGPFIC